MNKYILGQDTLPEFNRENTVECYWLFSPYYNYPNAVVVERFCYNDFYYGDSYLFSIFKCGKVTHDDYHESILIGPIEQPTI